MCTTLRRVTKASLAGGAVGLVTAFVLAIVYAVADLYLSGHGIKPYWFESFANTLLSVVVIVTAVATATVAWRVNRVR